MRFADSPVLSCEVTTAAPPGRVWELVTDIGLPARTGAELYRVEWVDGATAPAVGARFVGHNRNAVLGEWRTLCEITELRAERAFAWAVTDPDGRFGVPADPTAPAATWRFDLEPDGTGTRLRHSVRIGPSPSGLTVAIARYPHREEEIMASRAADLRANMRTTLTTITTLAPHP